MKSPSIKSPAKIERVPIIAFAIGGVFMDLLYIFTDTPWSTLSSEDIVFRIIRLLAYPVVFAFFGWIMAFSVRTIFTRKVTHPTDPKNLIVGQIYWLNGSHPAKYLGRDNDSGLFRFSVAGWNDPENPKSSADLTPIRVRTFISTVQEVYPEYPQTRLKGGFLFVPFITSMIGLRYDRVSSFLHSCQFTLGSNHP